jgi:hypothetical protein
MTAQRFSFMSRLLAVAASMTGLAGAAEPLQGIDAEREEVRLENEYKRATVADAYLTRIADRISAAAPSAGASRLRIRALIDRKPFAFCLGNGSLYVSTGLLARLENDSQVAAILAPEITSALAPNRALQAEFDAKNGKHLGAKLFAVIATGGMAVFPILSAENKALTSQAEALILDNDITAANWVRRAGFDVTQGPVATRRLLEQLGAEQQFGFNRLSSEYGLKTRAEQLERAIAALPAADTVLPTVPAAIASPAPASTLNTPKPVLAAGEPAQDELKKLSWQFSMLIAYDYLEHTQHASLPPLLDRIEREHGVDGRTACLRARYLRELPTGSAVPSSVIEAYEKCLVQPDAPVVYHRELAFLQRDSGNAAGALKSFEDYLKRAPLAVDAPIIKLYIEELRAPTP